MTRLLIAALFLSAVDSVSAAEMTPARPSPAQVAKILGIDESRVSADTKDQNPKLKGKVLWLATYKITGEQNCSLTITLFPDDQIKADFIEKIGANQTEFQKIANGTNGPEPDVAGLSSACATLGQSAAQAQIAGGRAAGRRLEHRADETRRHAGLVGRGRAGDARPGPRPGIG
jgi:hypothetical protein